MKLIQWRHVCDITTIRTTSQKTTPTAKQPLFRAPREKLIVFYSSLAVSHGVEVRSRTNEAKTAAFEQRHSCRIHTHTHSHQQCQNYLHQKRPHKVDRQVLSPEGKKQSNTQGSSLSHTHTHTYTHTHMHTPHTLTHNLSLSLIYVYSKELTWA